MERYTLQHGKHFLWACTDTESGLVITFREGLLDSTKNINIDNLNEVESPKDIHSLLKDMTDWLAENHRSIIECNIDARCAAIDKLNREGCWGFLAERLKDQIVHNEFIVANSTSILGIAVCYADGVNFYKWDVHREDFECLDELEEIEAYEVLCLCSAFWEYHEDEWIQEGLDGWAHDILWWPAFAPQGRKEPQNLESFGRKLRDTRQLLNITLQELYKRSGLDSDFISRIEDGKENASIHNILAISNAMGTDLTFQIQEL